jgi:hypothetical protein
MAYLTVDRGIMRLQKAGKGTLAAHTLKKLLVSEKRGSYFDHLLVIEGVFFASALFSYGWWQRKDPSLVLRKDRLSRDRKSDQARKRLQPLQHFLFNGFEQWAPSWDVNNWRENNHNLVGQIGTNDEADSIPVIVQDSAAAVNIREALSDKLVANATVTGLLCHSSRAEKYLQPTELALVKAMRARAKEEDRDEQFYFLLVQDPDEGHRVTFSTAKVDYYTGYVWQCWVPNEWMPERRFEAQIDDAFFVWQHANLADRDTVNLRMDGLHTDVKNIRKMLVSHGLSGKMTLLQHLMPEQNIRDTKASGQAGKTTAEKDILSFDDFNKMVQR